MTSPLSIHANVTGPRDSKGPDVRAAPRTMAARSACSPSSSAAWLRLELRRSLRVGKRNAGLAFVDYRKAYKIAMPRLRPRISEPAPRSRFSSRC